MTRGEGTAYPSLHISDSPEFLNLKLISARLGADPEQVQAGGGNTSLKLGDRLIIKASGKQLRNALEEDIFLTVSTADICSELETSGVDDNELRVRTLDSHGLPSFLRPSIETTFHAVLSAPVVLHTHSTSVLAYAILQNGAELITTRLAGLPWTWIPYAKPGPRLARQIATRVQNGNLRVFILANHGVVVTGNNVAEAASLLDEVERRLQPTTFRAARPANLDVLSRVAQRLGKLYQPAGDPTWHLLGVDPTLFEMVTSGSLYPDHVVFLGPAISFVHSEEASMAFNRSPLAMVSEPLVLLVAGAGCLAKADLRSSPSALMACLASVARKVLLNQPVNYLSTADEAELLSWDAEQYRQKMAGGK